MEKVEKGPGSIKEETEMAKIAIDNRECDIEQPRAEARAQPVSLLHDAVSAAAPSAVGMAAAMDETIKFD